MGMKPKTYGVTVFVLTLGGFLFSGYLSASKLLLKRCAFGEGCPVFLGQPACYFGFGMFFIMFAASLWAILNWQTLSKVRKINLWVSLLGVLFAGQFVVQEIASWIQNGNPHYTLFFPTCAYGLVFYIAILILSLLKLKEEIVQRSQI